jgi:hypothetical protein
VVEGTSTLKSLSLMFPSAVSMGTVLMSSSFHHHVHNMGITLLDRMTPRCRAG